MSLKNITLLLFLIPGLVWGCRPDSSPTKADQGTKTKAVDDEKLKHQIDQFCGACHKTPLPSSFPKSAWFEEVKRGYEFYYASSRTDLKPPPQAEVVTYYRNLAPESLFEKAPEVASTPSPISFRKQVLKTYEADSTKGDAPGISFLEWSKVREDAFQYSDMKHGEFGQLLLDGTQSAANTDSTISPVAVRKCDLNQNQQADLLIADLGSFLPEDHDLGKVVWIADYQSGNSEPVTIFGGIGRVADVRTGDFDGDGLEDIVVAEFGWHTTGGIHLLYNLGIDQDGSERPQFQIKLLDERPGAIHIPTVDLNQDGRLDFVALISQEFEEVVAFLNQPDGFEKVILYAAPGPSHGSSGIELVDLDQDGDEDILYTNGDTFDSALAKPYHGISWLENKGELEFKEHRLAQFPGVHRALAGDLDGDGDLDIASVSLLPHKVLEDEPGLTFDSVIWLEQTEPGQYERHMIESGAPVYSCLEVGDFDSDGDIDLATGHFLPTKNSKSATISIFWNDGAISK